MKRFKVSAPGKLHLLGEHVVVYNKPAILVAVDKRCIVEITARKDKKIKIASKNYKSLVTTTIAEIVEKFEQAEYHWKKYNENNDVSILKFITKDPLDYPQLIIGQFLNYHKIKSISGFDLTIDSQVPVGCGMGSSGSLAVSMIGALSLFANKPFNKKTINGIAFLAEKKKHGKPSGGDNSTSCYGKLVWFKKDEGIKPLSFGISENIKKNFYTVNIGTPKETTGEMVSRVRKLNEEKPLLTKEIFDRQGKLVKDLKLALEKNLPKQITNILKMGEANLEKLGVVSKYAKEIIGDIERSGGAAKICGGGGISESVGIILIYHNNFKNLGKVLQSHKMIPSQLELGVEGVRIDG